MLRLDENGAPAGRTLAFRRYTAFDEGSIPSWLTPAPDSGTTAGSSYTIQSGLGGLLMTTAAVNGRAELNADTGFTLNDVAVVRLRVRALLQRSGSDFFGIFALGLLTDSATNGAGAGGYINNDAVQTFIRAYSGGSSMFIQTNMPELRKDKYQDMSIWLDCRTKDVFVGNGDQIKSVWPAAPVGLGTGTLRAQALVVTNASGGAKSALMREYELEAWT